MGGVVVIKMGQNNTRCIVWAISEFFFFLFYCFRPLRMLADIYFVLILIVFITCNILYTLFFKKKKKIMIPIYPKKCKKSNKSKRKVVDLGCTRRFHFFKVLKSTKKEPFPISYFLLEAP